MIDELQVQDIALIRQAGFVPARGLTVITGETGAGKTALLCALKLLCGERADSAMVRQGAESLLVQARFFPRNPALSDSEGVVAQRSVTADGRSRVSLAGKMAQVGDLAQVVGSTIDLCGQHEHQMLMRPSSHVSMLDDWAGGSVSSALEAYRQAYRKAQLACERVQDVRSAGELNQAQVEQARFTLRRIDEIAPEEGEYERLQAEVPRIENAEGLKASVEGAHQALSGDGGVLDALGHAAGLLDTAGSLDARLQVAAQSLREAGYIVEDVARDVRSFADGVEYDPAVLEQMQQRLGELQGLMRTWGPSMDEVLDARSRAQAAIQAVEGFEKDLAEALAEHERAEEDLQHAAELLHQTRLAAAPGFEQAVTGQMQRLQLEGSSLSCSIELRQRSDWSEGGPDTVQFLFQPAADLQPRPLAKIASGGEMSRVMLAIKVALGESDTIDTLVFDEVDAGVGGTAARALADVLTDLACSHQVIVVTHLAQVAVMADAHYVVSKTEGSLPQTTLHLVEGDERIAEVSRMLSGDTDPTSLQHAHQLIQEAEAVKVAGAAMHQQSIF